MTVESVYEELTKSSLTNVTFSGGEPFEQARELAFLAKYIKENYKKTFWVYSGYTFEQIVADPEKKVLLDECDVLVDGKFEKNNRELNMRFRGSLNQRIIDIKKSLEQGEVIHMTLTENKKSCKNKSFCNSFFFNSKNLLS